MTTEAKIQLTSTELGTTWMTYQSTSASLIMFDLFKEKTINKEAQNILADYIVECQNIKNKTVDIFNNENAVIPMGFEESDIVRESPPLFDDFFNIMFLRQMMKLNFGHSAVSLTMSYMKEVNDILKLNFEIANNYYLRATNFLLENGVLPKPPYVTMPTTIEFVEGRNYMSGFNPLSEKRALNTIEVGYINEAIEDNIFGMQMMTGFAQVAKESEVKNYFITGKELAKKIITELSKILLQSDIQPPSTWAGKATDSTIPPFSDKLMMYLTSIVSNASIGYTALGTSFSMRRDLHIKLGRMSKNIFDFSKEGGKIMIKHKWMEEPPQMEDRNQLTK